MTPKLVTFDCAHTIVDVTWTVDGFIHDCMAAISSPVTIDEARRYARLYLLRLPTFHEINRRRDPEEGAVFWRKLGADWLRQIGRDEHLLEPLVKVADELAYGKKSILFRPYADVVPCFERLRNRGIRLAVVSNWDYSLHRVLGMFGYDRYLDLALASLEEGVEKPDPRLFQIALERLDVDPDEAIHVGDNPEDDVQGATLAGMKAILIDRSGTTNNLGSLDRIEEAFEWID